MGSVKHAEKSVACIHDQVSRLSRVGDECVMVVYRDYDPVRRRVARFYAAYNPVKLEEVGFVDEVAKMYAREGEEVFSRLVSKYGPEPGLESTGRSSEEIESAVGLDGTVEVKDETSVSSGGVSLVGSSSAEPADALNKGGAGLESSKQEPSSLSTGTSSKDIRSRLERFYSSHNPVKVKEAGFIDKMVERYASEGEELFARLVAQYGSEPVLGSGEGGDGGTKDSSGNTEKASGSSTATVEDKVLGESDGDVDGRSDGRRDGNANVVKEVNDAVDERGNVLQRLESFYGLYNPAKLKEVGFVDKVLDAYAGKEEKLFARLVEQYGPEPGMESVSGVEGSISTHAETGAVGSDDDSASAGVKRYGVESSVSLRKCVPVCSCLCAEI